MSVEKEIQKIREITQNHFKDDAENFTKIKVNMEVFGGGLKSLQKSLDRHLEIYANNGKEMAKLAEEVKNQNKILESYKVTISKIALREEKNTNFRNKILGALAVISFIGLANMLALIIFWIKNI
ncbi:hypothetical protein [Persephonella sp.]